MVCVRNVYQRYVDLWRRLTGWKRFLFYALHYTVLFALLWRWLYSDFYEANKSFIESTDELSQFLTLGMVYISQTIRDGIQTLLNGGGWTIPLYDFRTGPALLNFQGLEIFPFSILWPWDKQDVLHEIVVVFLHWCVGTAFSYLGFYFKQKPLPVMIGAISYAFCGYALWINIHIIFLLSFIYLPLLIVGSEKVMRRETPFLLIISVFLTLTYGILFAYILAVFTVLYVIIRLLFLYSQNRLTGTLKAIGRLAVGAGVGTLLSGIVWVPSLVQLLNSPRIGRNVSEYRSLFFHFASTYKRIFSSLIVNPVPVFTYCSLGFSSLAIPAIILLFVKKRKQWNQLRLMFLLLTAMLCMPWVSYALSGFNEVLARWCYAYALCIAAVITFVLPHFVDIDRHTFIKVCICVLVYFAVCYFILGKGYYREEVFALLAISILAMGCFRLGGEAEKKYILPVCLALTCLSVYYSAHLLFDSAEQNFTSMFLGEGKAYTTLEAGQYASLGQDEQIKADESFFHVAGNDISHAEINASFYSGVNGLTFYSASNAFSSAWVEWCKELELRWPSISIEFMGLLNRTSMLTLSNVKYYANRENSSAALPYGFTEIGQVKKDTILENNYFLPVGYTYDKYLSRDDYEKLSALEKQEAQLQAVVLEHAPDSAQITPVVLDNSAQQIAASMTEMKGLTWNQGIVSVNEKDATITLEFAGLPGAETYLRIVNLDLTDGAVERDLTIRVSTESTAASTLFTADAYRLSNGRKTQLLELGYTETGYTTCTITFPSKGIFRLEGLEIWCQPMGNYGKQVNALRENVLENIKTNWRGLKGTVSVLQDKILCFTIPYSDGWSVYVDGKQAELLNANTAFMAVELPAGKHEVELCYWMPGLTVGFSMSVVGMVSLVALIIYWRRMRQERSVKSGN